MTVKKFVKNNEKYVAGFALALLAIIIIYSPEIFNSEPTGINVDLCSYEEDLDYNFIEFEKQYVNIPDYDADIFIEPKKSTYNINSIAKFTLKIEDKGIERLNSSYFYVFLFDSEDQLRGIFPCLCGEESSNFKIDGYRCDKDAYGTHCYIQGSKGSTKLKEWNQYHEWEKSDGIKYHCTDKENDFCVANECRSRNSLISGSSNGEDYFYSFIVDKVGTWKIHSFVLEKEYEKREFGSYFDARSRDPYDNAVAHGEAKFEVVRENSDKSPSFFWYLRNALIIVITFASIVGLTIKFYEKVKKYYFKYQQQIHWIIILVITLVILTLLICKTSCPA